MRATWLGWAGVEIESDGSTVVIDPLQDAAAVFAALGDRAAGMEPPRVHAPTRERALAGLVTHLHRDHTDAAALRGALAPGAVVLGPGAGGGEAIEEAALAQSHHELQAAGIDLQTAHPWSERQVGPFRLAALPAVDGIGDPQLSWLVEAEGVRMLHLGDTMMHGFWWRMRERFGPFVVVFLPINGAVLNFPHRQPPCELPAVLDPIQAAVAAGSLKARLAVPMHFGGYAVDPFYRPVPRAAEAFTAAAAARDVPVRTLALGESLEVGARVGAAIPAA